ncbi:MAG: hypothetical protein QF570_21830 [Myxococcota bacterium]|jgi:hypothetical protein|nr:hypothetical protein [Myxococcota bacterium]
MPPAASPSTARVQTLIRTLNQELDPELGARIARADRPRDDGSTGNGTGNDTPPLPSGLPQIDSLIGGGFPRGSLSEITGPASSGRTSLGLALLARLTRAGDYVAWIDAADAFDPLSAEGAGVVLERVLWVRAPDPMAALRCSERVLETEGFGLVGIDLSQGQKTPSIPEAAWLRLTRRVVGKRLALLLLSNERLSGSRAGLALELEPANARFLGMPQLLEPLEPQALLTRPFHSTGPARSARPVRLVSSSSSAPPGPPSFPSAPPGPPDARCLSPHPRPSPARRVPRPSGASAAARRHRDGS